MSILNWTTSQTGLAGVTPRLIFINTNDTVGAVTTTGYLTQAASEGMDLSATDMALVSTTTGSQLYQVSITGTVPSRVFSLVAPTSGGNIIAGSNGVAGYLASYSSTSASGYLKLQAIANSGNFITTISNIAMGQATTISIPDPGASTARFAITASSLVNGNIVKASGTSGLLVDAGFALLAKTTAVFAGGSASNAYAATGLVATSIVVVTSLATTNAVSIIKAVPGTNTLTVTWSADPGAATTVSYVAITPAV